MEELVRFKYKADEHMANMVSEEKFRQSMSLTVNYKDYGLLQDKVKELNQMV
jgi:hypothetical protein